MNCSKNTSTIKVVTIKNMDDLRYEGKPLCATVKFTPFTVSQDEWDTYRSIVLYDISFSDTVLHAATT